MTCLCLRGNRVVYVIIISVCLMLISPHILSSLTRDLNQKYDTLLDNNTSYSYSSRQANSIFLDKHTEITGKSQLNANLPIYQKIPSPQDISSSSLIHAESADTCIQNWGYRCSLNENRIPYLTILNNTYKEITLAKIRNDFLVSYNGRAEIYNPGVISVYYVPLYIAFDVFIYNFFFLNN